MSDYINVSRVKEITIHLDEKNYAALIYLCECFGIEYIIKQKKEV